MYGSEFVTTRNCVEKAVAGWWIGRKDESKTLFQHLLDDHKMSEEYVNGCLNNLKLFI